MSPTRIANSIYDPHKIFIFQKNELQVLASKNLSSKHSQNINYKNFGFGLNWII